MKKNETYTQGEARMILRGLVRTKYDYQHLRVATANRLKKKKDGSNQSVPEGMDSQLDVSTVPDVVDTWNDAEELEKALDKRIASYLRCFPIYTGFLKYVRGCGPAISAVIISEIDIHKATTRSKIWQFAGCNPSMVYGKKKVDGKTVTTDTMVRGDELTKGFIAPYNSFLKTKLLGVLADCMIKSKSQYKVVYDQYKLRLSNETNEYKEGRRWCDESKAHIDMAARRKMIKAFLSDLYEVWREMEGLEVRCTYEQEYLGHETSQASIKDAILQEARA